MKKSEVIKKASDKVAEFPFKVNLSFLPIIRHWEEIAKNGSTDEKRYAISVLKEIEEIPEFRKSVKNPGVFLEKNRKVVDKLMSAIFPKALEFNEIKAATPPFSFDNVFMTKRFRKIVDLNKGPLLHPYNLDPEIFPLAKYLHANLMLLGKFHGRSIPLETPFIYKMSDPETGLDMYYKMTINADFVDVSNTGKLKKLSEKDIDEMVNNLFDVDLWKKNLPPESFEMNGFVVCTLVNVTLTELLSHLKNNLLEKDAILTESNFEVIRHNVRSLFKIPDLKVGLGVFKEEEGILNFGHWSWRDLVCKGRIKNIEKEFKGSIYQKVLESGEPVIVDDIDKLVNPTGIEQAIKETCVKSFIVAPLKYSDDIVGYLELGSCKPKELNSVSMARVDEILPLFSVAMQRSVEERENKIDAIIMEKCTAIHHSVQWRFQEVAKKYLRARERGATDIDMDPIVFEDVYPLYGMADIRDSSEHRNRAIQADLITQLELAQGIILKAKSKKRFPVLEEMNFRIEKLIDSIGKKLRSEDESIVYRLLSTEVEPFFEFAMKECPDMASEIKKYNGKLDPKLGVVYKRRKSYELSVTKINSALSEFLETKQIEGQDMYPHYFEKYKTDGLDYNIYVGESLLKNGIFNKMCLSNIRLWQLIMMAEMTQLSSRLVSELPIPLKTAQLILVHDEPMAIRFRVDEKKFDVDGAYNIRYEIIKKRIDKALIKGSEERVTQPGTIAIVYTQSEVKLEYLKYFDFLQHKELIEKEVEELELEDSQGVTGLKALRIKVKVDPSESVGTSEIEEIISSLQK